MTGGRPVPGSAESMTSIVEPLAPRKRRDWMAPVAKVTLPPGTGEAETKAHAPNPTVLPSSEAAPSLAPFGNLVGRSPIGAPGQAKPSPNLR